MRLSDTLFTLKNVTDRSTIPFDCLFVEGCRVSFGIEQSFLADVGITHPPNSIQTPAVISGKQMLMQAKVLSLIANRKALNTFFNKKY